MQRPPEALTGAPTWLPRAGQAPARVRCLTEILAASCPGSCWPLPAAAFHARVRCLLPLHAHEGPPGQTTDTTLRSRSAGCSLHGSPRAPRSCGYESAEAAGTHAYPVHVSFLDGNGATDARTASRLTSGRPGARPDGRAPGAPRSTSAASGRFASSTTWSSTRQHSHRGPEGSSSRLEATNRQLLGGRCSSHSCPRGHS